MSSQLHRFLVTLEGVPDVLRVGEELDWVLGSVLHMGLGKPATIVQCSFGKCIRPWGDPGQMYV